TSVKPMPEIHAGNILALPAEPTLDPWRASWSTACVGVECVGIRGFYRNTFALTKFRFPAHRLVFGLILFGTFTPYQAILIPMAATLGKLGLSGSLLGLILVHTIY